ncbi:aminoglycoside 3-N-acetyltransferase [Deinococcus yavapaiensis]|uniref:Aminoglycoside N(3)-acetyltransferase n=1 Tax=Deinococcus yavapaiensis KR-236 TaxID=694435 RepID=A0A318S5I1_9DEIO|nr:aminoglycoside 3-N-acetyltransferase [Deinococcus yavapaiensis]PYE54042.1 aminoglycoside 3-N-acetyltransferase [Deinococcus yavapaiensis KR-236]
MAEPARPLVTIDDLQRDLLALGVQAGQVLMLHASVKRVGWVVGGPDALLRALLDLVTPTGTLMMLAGWEDNPYELNDWTEEKRQAYLQACPAFDPQTSRADHREMSILAEYLRTTSGARRSTHPSSSFVALGAQAEHLLSCQPDQYPFGHDSPLGRFCALGGQVLLLGELFENMTVLHHAEQLARLPNKRVVRYRMPILQDGRRVWKTFEEYDTTNGIADWPVEYFEVIGRSYVNEGRGRVGRVGAAPAFLLDGRSLVEFGQQWMELHLARSTDASALQ